MFNHCSYFQVSEPRDTTLSIEYSITRQEGAGIAQWYSAGLQAGLSGV